MAKSKLSGNISVEEVLRSNREFRNNLEREESTERIETVDSIINDIKASNINTELKKNQFINEIKSNLGKEVKNNPGHIRKIEKKWYQKLGLIIKNIFTKF